MKNRWRIICILSTGLWNIFIISRAFSQGTESGILPPPVEVQFSMEKPPGTEREVTFKLKVVPSEDMHADISCLLPVGIAPLPEEGVVLRPYEDRPDIGPERQDVYREAVVWWVGFLKAGEAKEFLLRAKVLDRGRHELIARIEALAQWGVKEEAIVVEV